MKKVLFPGSFDPFTLGHLYLVETSLKLFDHVVIGVGENSVKSTSLLTSKKKIDCLSKLFIDSPNVSIAIYKGLTVDFCKQNNIATIIRGVRNYEDFNYENIIAQNNLLLSKENVTTIFLPTPSHFSHINSKIVREIIAHKRDYSELVPKPIFEYLNQEINES